VTKESKVSLKAIIRRNKLVQNEIAEAVGIAAETLSRWVSGTVTPSGANLVRLANHLRQFEPDLAEADLLAPEPDAVDCPVATVAPTPDAA
jgi:transcriptional regulator with XRE-family HTH domain